MNRQINIQNGIIAYRHKQYNKAYYLLGKYEDQGIEDVSYYLGMMYLHGQGAPLNYYKAYELFNSLRKLGHGEAYRILNWMLSQSHIKDSIDKEIVRINKTK